MRWSLFSRRRSHPKGRRIRSYRLPGERAASVGSAYDVIVSKTQSSSSMDHDSVPTSAARINQNNFRSPVSFQQATMQPFKRKTQKELSSPSRTSSGGSADDVTVNEHQSSSSVDHDSVATSAARINQNNFRSPVSFRQATKQPYDPKVLPEYKRLQAPSKASSAAPAPAPKTGEAKRNPQIKLMLEAPKEQRPQLKLTRARIGQETKL